MPAIIEVNHLTKEFKVARKRSGMLGALLNLAHTEYRLIKAVDEVSFSIQPGELIGYIGPNGAGKSTTIKMLTGLLVPTHGRVLVDGLVPWQARQKYVARIGAVFGQRTTLWWDLPVSDSLDLLQYIYRIPSDRFKRNLARFTQILELEPFIHTPVRSLSLGQRMRADLAAALLHDPLLLFLDEPTIGLDVVAKERIRQFIQHINREDGTTILLTTHDLSDVEKLCDRVMILDHGRLLYDGGLDPLLHTFGGSRSVVVVFAEEYPDLTLPGLEPPVIDGGQVIYPFDRSQISAPELIARLTDRFQIHDLAVREPELEDTIRRIYEERLLENSSPLAKNHPD